MVQTFQEDSLGSVPMNIQMTLKARGVSMGQWTAVTSTNDNHRTGCREEDRSTPCLVNVRVLLPSYLGEERVYFAYFSISLFLIKDSRGGNSDRAGMWRQGLMQRSWRGLLTHLLPMAWSACSFTESSATKPGMTSTQSELGSSSSNHQARKCATALPADQSGVWGVFLN